MCSPERAARRWSAATARPSRSGRRPRAWGRANDACAELLAGTFGVTASQLELVGGRTSRSKTFRITGVGKDDFARLLERALGDGPPGTGPESPQTGRR